MASANVQNAPQPARKTLSLPRKLPSLRSNYGNHIDPESTGWMLPTPLSTPFPDMRTWYESDGYIWIKNLIPREDVLDMREHYFSQFTHTGMLLPQTTPRDGIYDPSNDPLAHQGLGGTPEAQSHELLDAAHATPTYRNFLAHPALRTFVRKFMGWRQEILVKRALLRHNCPGSLSTGIHYDQTFLRAGEAAFLTAWIPIGDCAATGGGLMYLENSCDLGKEIEREFTQNAELSPEERINAFNKYMTKDGYLSHDAEEFARVKGRGKLKWLVGDYEAGDVVFHKPYMIHAATKNEDEMGRIRLASDLRFYEDGADLDKRWNYLYKNGDGL